MAYDGKRVNDGDSLEFRAAMLDPSASIDLIESRARRYLRQNTKEGKYFGSREILGIFNSIQLYRNTGFYTL